MGRREHRPVHSKEVISTAFPEPELRTTFPKITSSKVGISCDAAWPIDEEFDI
jgi:hypothetical protein